MGDVWAGAYSAVAVGSLAVLARNSVRMPSGRSAWVLLLVGATQLVGTQLVLIWGPSAGGSLEIAVAGLERHRWLFVLSLTAYAFLYAGQMLLLRQRVRGLMPSAWVDGVVASILVMSLACAVGAAPGLLGGEVGAVAGAALVARPLLDLLMAAFAVANWSLSGWRSDPRLPVLAAGFTVLTASDTAGVLRVVGVVHAPVGAIWIDDLGRLGCLVLVCVASSWSAPVAQRVRQQSPAPDLISPVAVLGGSLSLLVVDRLGVLDIGGAAFVFCVLGLVGVGVKFLVVVREVARLSAQEHLAGTDDLTHLANRRHFSDTLARALLEPEPLTLLLLDLDSFKAVNDHHGHVAGDELLVEIGRRLTAVLTELDPAAAEAGSPSPVRNEVPRGGAPVRHLAARLGGDEFAILLHDTDEVAGALVAAALIARVCAPVSLAGHQVDVTASIGVTTANQPGLPRSPEADPAVDELLRRADVAMYRAKNAGSAVSIFDAAFDEETRARTVLLEELRTELGRPTAPPAPTTTASTGGRAPVPSPRHPQPDPDQQPRAGQHLDLHLVPYFQPQVDARTARPEGLEALARWHHPRLGLLGPATFLPLAEEQGLIGAVSRRMLTEAVHHAASWRAAGHSLQVSVNLSASCLLEPDLIALVDQLLSRTGLPAQDLMLEVTETSLMSDQVHARQTARAIRERGVGISIDDYGTGYSALSYLKDLPATELKIDRSFITDLGEDDRTTAIVAATIDMATTLGLQVVAEGVETVATHELLTSMGCHRIQGFLHARPLPPDTVLSWLEDRARSTQPRDTSARSTSSARRSGSRA